MYMKLTQLRKLESTKFISTNANPAFQRHFVLTEILLANF